MEHRDETSQAAADKVKLLLVDDVKMNLKMADLILGKRLPCETFLAESGMKCLEILAKNPMDLILLDVAMPDFDGIETLQVIRKVDRLKDIPVIFLTGSADPLTIVKATELHVDDYIRKPFVPDDLVHRVVHVLQTRRGKLLELNL